MHDAADTGIILHEDQDGIEGLIRESAEHDVAVIIRILLALASWPIKND